MSRTIKTNGPGKYDALCTHVRESAGGDGAVVMVWGGAGGFGFAVQVPACILLTLPEALESMAKQIRAQLEEAE